MRVETHFQSLSNICNFVQSSSCTRGRLPYDFARYTTRGAFYRSWTTGGKAKEVKDEEDVKMKNQTFEFEAVQKEDFLMTLQDTQDGEVL